MKHEITLRPIADDDQPFLCRLYATTRADEMAVVDWTEAQKTEFLTMQFTAQHKFYLDQFRQASFDVLMLGQEPIGRLYVDRRPDEIRIIDIALLPAYRNRGIGSHFMKQLLAEAGERGVPVRIHVEHYNPAMRLYERLGFRQIDEDGVYHLMEWSAERQPTHR